MLGMGVFFGSHYSECTVRYAQKYTGACRGATEAMQIGSLVQIEQGRMTVLSAACTELPSSH